MSLTSLLKQPSPVREFFRSRLGHTRRLVRDVNDRISPLPVHGRPDLSQHAAALVGTAFDYRVRAYWPAFDPWETAAARGYRVLLRMLGWRTGRERLLPFMERGSRRSPRALGGPAGRCVAFFRHICRVVKDALRGGHARRARAEERLHGAMLALAYFEQFYRAGGMFEVEASRLGDALIRRRRVESIERVICGDEAGLADLTILARMFERYWPREFRSGPVVLNPTFAGSAAVGGADGDILANKTLIELKTTRRLRPLRAIDLWQLLGYVFLDHKDSLSIERVGIFLARRGKFVSWRVSELTVELSNGAYSPVEKWRAAFRQVVREDDSGVDR